MYEIRRRNLNTILEAKFNGNKAALASSIDRQPSYISRCLITGNPHHKTIGEKFARHVEQSLYLPACALDAEPSPDSPLHLHLLGIPLTALEEGPTFSRPFRRTKIVGTAQLGPEGYWDAMATTDGWLDVPSSDPDAYSLRVRGDSMAPAIRSGWVVWCEPNHALIPSEYVMVRRTNGECMVKELLYANADEVSLMAVNDGYGRLTIAREDIEQVHYVGGIVPPSKIKY